MVKIYRTIEIKNEDVVESIDKEELAEEVERIVDLELNRSLSSIAESLEIDLANYDFEELKSTLKREIAETIRNVLEEE